MKISWRTLLQNASKPSKQHKKRSHGRWRFWTPYLMGVRNICPTVDWSLLYTNLSISSSNSSSGGFHLRHLVKMVPCVFIYREWQQFVIGHHISSFAFLVSENSAPNIQKQEPCRRLYTRCRPSPRKTRRSDRPSRTERTRLIGMLFLSIS